MNVILRPLIKIPEGMSQKPSWVSSLHKIQLVSG